MRTVIFLRETLWLQESRATRVSPRLIRGGTAVKGGDGSPGASSVAFRVMYFGDLKEAEEKKRCFPDMRAVRVCMGTVRSWPEAVTERLVKGTAALGGQAEAIHLCHQKGWSQLHSSLSSCEGWLLQGKHLSTEVLSFGEFVSPDPQTGVCDSFFVYQIVTTTFLG